MKYVREMISLGVWILMLIVDLLVPVFLIIYGSVYTRKVPADINGSNGYKTARSRLSQETWEFANHYSARIERIVGWILLVFSLVIMLLFREKDAGTVSGVGVCVLVVQVVALVLAIVLPTEAALKKNFDETGKRK